MVILVMGVSGAGKSTVGRRLASRLGCVFAEGDDYHPAANLAKMRAGEPLDDDDRAPWLERLAAEVQAWSAGGRDVVLACSALRRAYRDRLRGRHGGVRLVYLRGEPELIRARLAARRDHFMPAGLLDSQLVALEPPGADEGALEVDVAGEPDRLVEALTAALARRAESEGKA